MGSGPAAGRSPATARVATQQAYLGQRERELLERLPRMTADEMRWTVRLFADCLTAEARGRLLADYDETLGPEGLRQFLTALIPAYTAEALADLHAVRTEGPLALTAEELQSLACAEKWTLLDADPTALDPEALRRELARLACCRSYELFHDTDLARGAIEYAGYFGTQAMLASLEPAALDALREDIRAVLRRMEGAGPEEADRLLAGGRARIARAIALPGPVDEMLGAPMALFSLDGFWGRGDAQALLAAQVRPAGPAQTPEAPPGPTASAREAALTPAPQGPKRGKGNALPRWEYRDHMVVFEETREGLMSNLAWMNEWGSEGWELVSAVPLIAPNKDGVAYGTVGALLLFKRPR